MRGTERIPVNCLSDSKLISLLDVTSLNGADTTASIDALLDKVLSTYERSGNHPAAVCVFPAFLELAKLRLHNTPVKLATVAAGFPHGLSPTGARIQEVAQCREEGADEIDVVIRRFYALEGNWAALEDDVSAFRSAAGRACLKVIIEISELKSGATIYAAATSCLKAGADFIKTSTGKSPLPATLDQGRAALQAIADFKGKRTGFKAAGGIKSREDTIAWIRATQEVLGEDQIDPRTFRIGASGLFDALVADLV